MTPAQATKITRVHIDDIAFVAELYPRSRPDDKIIQRYRLAIDHLPRPAVGRLVRNVSGPDEEPEIVENALVDGYHGWQARRRESMEELEVEHLGELDEQAFVEESVRRNAAHGHQLSAADKESLVRDRLWDAYDGSDAERIRLLAELLSVATRTIERWGKDIREEQLKARKRRAWALHLRGWSNRKIARELEVDDKTIASWLAEFATDVGNSASPSSLQIYDVWEFPQARGESQYFGKMPPQVVENLLWLYTEPEQIVFDPFAGGGTTVLVALEMGRKVFAADLEPSDLTLGITQHDILSGWPSETPSQVDFVLLDPPYWQQAKGRYPGHTHQLGDMPLADFMTAWAKIVSLCVKHLRDGGKLAYIISPTQENWKVIDHALEMREPCLAAGLKQLRRIIVPYQSQQTHGGHVEKARAARGLLARYRDLIVFEK